MDRLADRMGRLARELRSRLSQAGARGGSVRVAHRTNRAVAINTGEDQAVESVTAHQYAPIVQDAKRPNRDTHD